MRSAFELPAALALLLLAASAGAGACSDDTGQDESQAGLSCAVSYEDFAGPLLLNWCVGCHSSALPEADRQGAPVGIDFDTLDGIRSQAERIRVRVTELQTMPPLGGPTPAERELLAEWIDCGLPASGDGFQPPPPSGLRDPEPPPTGTCAEPRQALPPEALPRCTAATKDCVIACSSSADDYDGEACRNACLAADTTPALVIGGFPVNCASCSLLQLLACADGGGCHSETADFMCCVEDCGGGDTCTSGPCAGELQAFGLCTFYTAPDCLDFVDGPISACFAEPAAGG